MTKMNEPMDASMPETSEGVPTTNNKRVCYAGQTLIAEVGELFPETTHEVTMRDGRGVGIEITFDASSEPELAEVLDLVRIDFRVRETLIEEGQVLVAFWSNARTQDLRDPFGLAAGLRVMRGDA